MQSLRKKDLHVMKWNDKKTQNEKSVKYNIKYKVWESNTRYKYSYCKSPYLSQVGATSVPTYKFGPYLSVRHQRPNLRIWALPKRVPPVSQCATLFRASHRPEKGTGRWIAEEGHRDPSKCALGYIYMNLECIFKCFFSDCGVFKIPMGASPHC
jgi:hypothetical protein